MPLGIRIFNHDFRQVDSVFPTENIKTSCRSFIITAGISLVSIGNGNTALLAGAIAATATLIESVVRGIFNLVFPRGGFDQQNWATYLIAYPLTSCLTVTPLENLIGCSYEPSGHFLRLLANLFIWRTDIIEATADDRILSQARGRWVVSFQDSADAQIPLAQEVNDRQSLCTISPKRVAQAYAW